MKLHYLNLSTTDPYFNLAAEQYVFDDLPRDSMYFMLWQNDNAVIIGKHQNTYAEINDAFVRKNDIHVVRRLSGGGAVYHDLGNLNYTFIADAVALDTICFDMFCEPVVQTLRSLGVLAKINGRNDITIDQKKFSGNSQYLKAGRVMHHGTIMFSSDLSVVAQALKVDDSKLAAKGIKSVRSRVTNVSEHLAEKMDISEFRSILLAHVLKGNPGEPYEFTAADLAQINSLKEKRYRSWEWNYGESPEFSIHKGRRVEGCGQIDAYITAEHGFITKIDFRGDFFGTIDPEELEKQFVGKRMAAEEYRKVLAKVDVSCYFFGLSNEKLIEILSE